MYWDQCLPHVVIAFASNALYFCLWPNPLCLSNDYWRVKLHDYVSSTVVKQLLNSNVCFKSKIIVSICKYNTCIYANKESLIWFYLICTIVELIKEWTGSHLKPYCLHSRSVISSTIAWFTTYSVRKLTLGNVTGLKPQASTQ